MSSGVPQVWKHQVSYHPEDVRRISRSSGDYYRVALPDKIEKAGFAIGDGTRIDKIDDKAPYLRVLPGPIQKAESRKPGYFNYQKIFQRKSKTWLSIPKQWVDEFIANKGDEFLIVEVNELEIEPHLRIYKNIDYNQYRIPELASKDNTPVSGQPIVGGLGSLYQLYLAGSMIECTIEPLESIDGDPFVADEITIKPEKGFHNIQHAYNTSKATFRTVPNEYYTVEISPAPKDGQYDLFVNCDQYKSRWLVNGSSTFRVKNHNESVRMAVHDIIEDENIDIG
ncbi:hypothetical protein OB919_15845 [Halobacteria archaeon AArc-curdl1]|uniref:Uncharacterized protein n=1 Tax=Natronosalvus hydrolyticus TaxID=2979988 RepID=A0AAP2ZA04_9EURY|nr:hypothetical protein [Halobacteria archaeon AArc-curdl1]